MPLGPLISSKAYWTALGQFVHEFARIEAGLQLFLWGLAEIPPSTAKAIFSGVRSDIAKSHITRIYESRGSKKPALIERAFDQIVIITDLRNKLIHSGATLDPVSGLVITTNSFVALPGREQSLPVSIKILEEAIADIDIILCCLTAEYVSTSPIPDDQRKLWEEVSQTPWRYKPPSLNNTRPPRPPSHKRANQRKSSPE